MSGKWYRLAGSLFVAVQQVANAKQSAALVLRMLVALSKLPSGWCLAVAAEPIWCFQCTACVHKPPQFTTCVHIAPALRYDEPTPQRLHWLCTTMLNQATSRASMIACRVFHRLVGDPERSLHHNAPLSTSRAATTPPTALHVPPSCQVWAPFGSGQSRLRQARCMLSAASRRPTPASLQPWMC